MITVSWVYQTSDGLVLKSYRFGNINNAMNFFRTLAQAVPGMRVISRTVIRDNDGVILAQGK